ncbi:expansin-B15-like [Actinidia eriantha]|uniref:expansin-B15-like n=1 Tax=Actinidia eriantha TaxID=165200 RepID=UPI0025833534|nr:expansin-B15-like [Actinidia eriantha]
MAQSPTIATWYGSPNGAGTDAGNCGYGAAVETSPFNKLIAAGGSSLFRGGEGCGTCYQVKCTSNPACSGNPVTITISDRCPECAPFQFDMSGTAFGAMALPGKADQLRSAGRLNVQYQRVQCNYHGFTITFTVDPGSNPFYFATNIEYEDGDGDLSKVEIQQANTNSFSPMQLSFGATWKFNDPSPSPLQAPFSLRLTNGSGKTVVASNVISVGWKPGQIFRSNVNFNN